MDTQPAAAPTTTQSVSHDRLMKALYFMLDLFSRPNIPFFLLDDTANAVYHQKALSGDHVTVGIRKVDLTPSIAGIMDAFATPDKMEPGRIVYDIDGVKAVVKVLDTQSPMFSNLNTFMYEYEAFSLPNPFNDYWKEKDKYL